MKYNGTIYRPPIEAYTLGRTGLKVSAIAYGGVVSTMGHYGYYKYPGDGQQASNDYVEYALESGVNYFDVAPMYGDAQEKLGNSLKGVRDRLTLACKTVYRDYDSAARDAAATQTELANIKSLMKKKGWTAEEAMDTLDIEPAKCDKYAAILSGTPATA